MWTPHEDLHDFLSKRLGIVSPFCGRHAGCGDGDKITSLPVFSAFFAGLSGAFPELLVIEAELEAAHVL